MNTTTHPAVSFGEPLKIDVPALALRTRDAAAALGICEAELRRWTNEGSVPHVRRGKVILFPVAALQTWLLKMTQEQGEKEETKNQNISA